MQIPFSTNLIPYIYIYKIKFELKFAQNEMFTSSLYIQKKFIQYYKIY